MALEAIIDRDGIDRVVLEGDTEGVYVLAFDSPNAPGPFRDYLQDDWDMAKRCALGEFGVTEAELRSAPDAHFNG